MRKSQILMFDVIIAFVILAIMTYVTVTLLQVTFTYEDDQLFTVVSDTAFALEITNLENITRTLENTPKGICLSLNVKTYNKNTAEEFNSTYYNKNGCNFLIGKKFTTKRTIVDDDYYWLLTIEGWFS